MAASASVPDGHTRYHHRTPIKARDSHGFPFLMSPHCSGIRPFPTNVFSAPTFQPGHRVALGPVLSVPRCSVCADSHDLDTFEEHWLLDLVACSSVWACLVFSHDQPEAMAIGKKWRRSAFLPQHIVGNETPVPSLVTLTLTTWLRAACQVSPLQKGQT